jgi:hypothetical protein
MPSIWLQPADAVMASESNAATVMQRRHTLRRVAPFRQRFIARVEGMVAVSLVMMMVKRYYPFAVQRPEQLNVKIPPEHRCDACLALKNTYDDPAGVEVHPWRFPPGPKHMRSD